jgi:hypothetical protein
MSDEKAVRGPMYIAATPLMVTADVEPLVHANVSELLELLSGEFFEDFITATSEESTGHDGHAPEALRFERLAEQLMERMSTRVALTGPQAVRVAGQMHKLGLPLAEMAERTKAAVSRGASLIKHPSHAATRRHLKANPLPEQRQDGAA